MIQKKIFFIVLFLSFLCIFILITYVLSKKSPAAIIDYHIFSLDIAKTPTQQEVGLAIYTSLAQNHAMYFPFSYANYYAFWMKNMHFPIDIIFIRDNKIVTIFHNVPAPKNNNTALPIYKPTTPANAVLEIHAGLSKEYGFHTGDNVIILY